MADRSPSERLDYELVFQALGRLAKERGMRDVVVMEFEQGAILQGYVLVSTTEGWVLNFKTETFGHEDLKKLVYDL
jgi:hypothetical protein